MKSRGAPVDVAEVRFVTVYLRCMCPQCVSLDLRYPDEGHQLGFWRYVPATGPMRGKE